MQVQVMMSHISSNDVPRCGKLQDMPNVNNIMRVPTQWLLLQIEETAFM